MALVSLGLWLGIGAAGCGSLELRLELAADAGYVTGTYMGSQDHVKLFVEAVKFEPLEQGAVEVSVAILNERAQPLLLELEESQLRLPDRDLLATDMFNTQLAAGELSHYALRFVTHLKSADLKAGSTWTLVVSGIRTSERKAVAFDVPLRIRALE